MNRQSVIINSGPLIALERVEQLTLLPKLFETVIVPQPVFEEVSSQSPYPFSALPSEISIEPLTTTLDPLLHHTLDKGEASVIQLARERSIEQVIIDERKGRKIARLYHLQTWGTARVLVEAKQAGCLESVARTLEQMRKQRYWISDTIYQWACRMAGEAE